MNEVGSLYFFFFITSYMLPIYILLHYRRAVDDTIHKMVTVD